jgi:hypothetical protein
LKPPVLPAVNGKWFLHVTTVPQGSRQIVPVWDLLAVKCSPPATLNLNFVLSGPAIWTKSRSRRHTGEGLASLKMNRFGFDRSGLGLGT